MLPAARSRGAARVWMGVGVVLLLAILGAWLWDPGWPDPAYEGRSASWWFRTLIRSVDGRSASGVEQRYFEARKALTGLGTNVVPMLVARALAADPDTRLRRAMREVISPVVELFGGAPFPQPGARAREALAILEALQPPASLVQPLVEPALRAGGSRAERALRVLARTADDPAVAVLVGDGLVDGTVRADEVVRDILAPLGRPTAASAAALADALRRPASRLAALGLLSRLGPEGRAAIPALEPLLSDANELIRLRTAFVLREIEPGHDGARAVVEAFGRSEPFDPWNQVTQAVVASVLQDVGGLLRVTEPVSVRSIEALARKEVGAWEAKGLAHHASAALERVSPERAEPLYAAQWQSTNRMNLRIVAAASVLRVGGTNGPAFAFLTNLAVSGDPAHLRGMAADGLGETDPRWGAAVRALERLIGLTSDAPWVRSKLEVSRERIGLRAEESAAR